MALPYIQNKGLRTGGIVLILIGVGSILTLLMMYKYSGKIIAEAKLSAPLPQASLTEQGAFGAAEKTIRNAMVDAKLPSADMDSIEWITARFNPVHLTPEMGEIAMILDITQQGIRASRSAADNPKGFGDRQFELKDVTTGEVAFSKKYDAPRLENSTNGVTAGIDHTGKKTNLKVNLSSKRDLSVGRTTVQKAGDYVLEAKIEKLRYAEPISDMNFVVKTGMAKEPSPAIIGAFVFMIVAGYFCVFVTIPPEKRTKKNN